MGFLDKLLKSKARELVSNVVGDAVDDVINHLSNSDDTCTGTNTTTTSSVRTTTINTDEKNCCYDKNLVCARIEDIAATEWPGYELRTNIPAYDLGAEVGSRDYTYGLYLDDAPKAMIIILDDPSHYRKKDTLLAHEACQVKGIFCMNLMLHLPNRRSYISERLRQNVK